MLAYVFRHWPVADVARGEYEARLVAFHEVLARAGVAGFRGSVVFRVSGAPGMATGQAGYEDWYLVDGSAGLDPLNDAAVSGARSGPRDEAARLAADGHGSLYRLRGAHCNPNALGRSSSLGLCAIRTGRAYGRRANIVTR